MKILWFLPTHGDARYLGSREGAREVNLDYLTQIAQTADRLGYYGVLTPTGRSCEDPWVVTASLIAATRQLRFLVALRPGLMEPALGARMAATFDRLSHGRLLINLVTGGNAAELAGDGQFLDHAERYAAATEFIHVWREIIARSHSGETFDFAGKHLKVEGARLVYPPLQRPHPPIWFGGSSDAAHDLAAEHAETYLSWGEPPAEVRRKFDDVRARAARQGRILRFGVRLHVIVRETEEEAWAAAESLISKLDDTAVAKAQKVFEKMDSEGQRRMAALHGQGKGRSRAELEIDPHLWAGVGLVRGGAGTAIVGNPRQVADKLREYQDAGADAFVLSGYPHLEEAYRFAELVFPLLDLDHARPAEPLPGNTQDGPFGELIANEIVPSQGTETTREDRRIRA